MNFINPTAINYGVFQDAYDFFNKELFGGRLPSSLITLQRKSKARGFFAARRFGGRDGVGTIDEIALNPKTFIGRSGAEIFSTLVHEMTHLEQEHFGTPPSTAYHNKEWADMMEAVGLIPSHTGLRGGKRTGRSMTHYIEEGGRYSQAYAKLAKKHKIGDAPYMDVWEDPNAQKKRKTKFTCYVCMDNAWGRPELQLICKPCGELMTTGRPVEV